MNPSVIRAARAIPAQLQKVVAAMFSESDQDLKRAVGELRQALRTVDDYARSIDGASPQRAAAPATGAPRTAKNGRRGRRRTRFKTGDFVVQQLQANPKGLRPRDIGEKLEVAAKGKHSNALSTVNTTLARLKLAGIARSTDGVWKLTGKNVQAPAKA